MDDYSAADWRHLGQCLLDARARLPRPNRARKHVARKADVSPKSIQEYEDGKVFVNGPPVGMRALAAYYGWAPGSIDRVLRGEEPTYKTGALAEVTRVLDAPEVRERLAATIEGNTSSAARRLRKLLEEED